MAFICYDKPSGSCHDCIHFRHDEDKNRKVCFAQIDAKEGIVDDDNPENATAIAYTQAIFEE